MSSLCCIDSEFLGCFASCGNINTGLIATQAGAHTVQYYFLDGICTKNIIGTIGLPLEIPADIFNEFGQSTFKIIQPDGNVFVSGGSDCFIVQIGTSTIC